MKKSATKQPATAAQIHQDFYENSFKPMAPVSSLNAGIASLEVVQHDYSAVLEKTGFTSLVPPPIYPTLFPFHKLIHYNQILMLCDKYKLFFSPTKDFVGAIPPKNMMEVQRFLQQYNYVHFEHWEKQGFWSQLLEREPKGKKYSFVKPEQIEHPYKEDTCYSGTIPESVFEWFIVAPASMVVTRKKRKWDTSDDPIIIGMIRPKFGCGGFQWWDKSKAWGVIVMAWGDEASDPAVVNEKMN